MKMRSSSSATFPASVDQADPRQLLAESDPEVYAAIELERARPGRWHRTDLPAKLCFSPAVLAAVGSVLTNKYAEGYPGKRYYGGCAAVDVAESLAIEQAKVLFGADHAGCAARSGAQANEAAYLALLKPGDTVLALKLDHGGHLTHGFHLNSSGRFYRFVHYGVDPESERLDYDEVERLATASNRGCSSPGPTPTHGSGTLPGCVRIADKVGARLLMDMAHIAGLVAARAAPRPGALLRCGDHDDPRNPARAARGLILCRAELAKEIDRSVFQRPGGPLAAC
jgi:glycine hydroxymethyltransferase